MIGFAAEASIVLSCRFRWRCRRIALDRNLPAFAIGQSIWLRPFISLQKFLAVAARSTEFSVQFFRALAFFVDAPGMVGRCATFRFFQRFLVGDWTRFILAPFIMPRLSRRRLA